MFAVLVFLEDSSIAIEKSGILVFIKEDLSKPMCMTAKDRQYVLFIHRKRWRNISFIFISWRKLFLIKSK